MAITASAKKAWKRSLFLRERNMTFKIAMKRAIKAVRKGVAEKMKPTELSPLLTQAYSAIDKAARRNIVHKKNAARKKSRLSALISSAAS